MNKIAGTRLTESLACPSFAVPRLVLGSKGAFLLSRFINYHAFTSAHESHILANDPDRARFTWIDVDHTNSRSAGDDREA